MFSSHNKCWSYRSLLVHITILIKAGAIKGYQLIIHKHILELGKELRKH